MQYKNSVKILDMACDASAGPGGTNPQTPDLMRQQTRAAPPHGPSHAQSVRITSSLIEGGDDSSENGNFRFLAILDGKSVTIIICYSSFQEYNFATMSKHCDL